MLAALVFATLGVLRAFDLNALPLGILFCCASSSLVYGAALNLLLDGRKTFLLNAVFAFDIILKFSGSAAVLSPDRKSVV